MSELKQFKLPDVGEGLTEADIVRWLVQPGDKIDINQIIVEIETAKALVELPSPYAGVVDDLLVPEGATADVGTPIISVQVGADGTAGAANGTADASSGEVGSAEFGQAPAPPADISPPPAEGAVEPGIYGSPAPKEQRQAVLVGYGVKLGATKRRPRKPAAAGARASIRTGTQNAARDIAREAAAEPLATGGAAARDARTGVLAKPPVRKLAKELGVDLAMLRGTGPSGSIA